MLIFLVSMSSLANDLSPFIKVGTVQGTIKDVYGMIAMALKPKKFQILGTYNPAGSKRLKVIVFTRNDIKYTVVKVRDRGALAAAMKSVYKKRITKLLFHMLIRNSFLGLIWEIVMKLLKRVLISFKMI